MRCNSIYLFVFLALLFTSTALAQPNRYDRKRLISKFEVTAGIGLLKSATYFPNSVTKFGYSFGGGIAHAFSNTFELKTRALFERKGSETVSDMLIIKDGVRSDITRDITTNLNYLTLSVMPVFHISKKKNVVVGAGGFYSFTRTIEVIEELRDNVNSANSVTHTYTSPLNFSTWHDFGMSAYAGYVFGLSKRTDLTAMVHYNKSLMDFDDTISTWQRNNVILLSVTFGIFR